MGNAPQCESQSCECVDDIGSVPFFGDEPVRDGHEEETCDFGDAAMGQQLYMVHVGPPSPRDMPVRVLGVPALIKAPEPPSKDAVARYMADERSLLAPGMRRVIGEAAELPDTGPMPMQASEHRRRRGMAASPGMAAEQATGGKHVPRASSLDSLTPSAGCPAGQSMWGRQQQALQQQQQQAQQHQMQQMQRQRSCHVATTATTACRESSTALPMRPPGDPHRFVSVATTGTFAAGGAHSPTYPPGAASPMRCQSGSITSPPLGRVSPPRGRAPGGGQSSPRHRSPQRAGSCQRQLSPSRYGSPARSSSPPRFGGPCRSAPAAQSRWKGLWSFQSEDAARPVTSPIARPPGRLRSPMALSNAGSLGFSNAGSLGSTGQHGGEPLTPRFPAADADRSPPGWPFSSLDASFRTIGEAEENPQEASLWPEVSPFHTPRSTLKGQPSRGNALARVARSSRVAQTGSNRQASGSMSRAGALAATPGSRQVSAPPKYRG